MNAKLLGLIGLVVLSLSTVPTVSAGTADVSVAQGPCDVSSWYDITNPLQGEVHANATLECVMSMITR